MEQKINQGLFFLCCVQSLSGNESGLCWDSDADPDLGLLSSSLTDLVDDNILGLYLTEVLADDSLIQDKQLGLPDNNGETPQLDTGMQDDGVVDIIREIFAEDSSQEGISNNNPNDAVELMEVVDNFIQPQSQPSSKTPGCAEQCAPPSIPINTHGVSVVIKSNSQEQAQPGKFKCASVLPRGALYTVTPQFQCDQCDFSSSSQQGFKVHIGRVHKVHTASAMSGNPKRCRDWRERGKIKKQKAEEELKILKEQNIALRAKEALLRNLVEQRRREAVRMGVSMELINFFK